MKEDKEKEEEAPEIEEDEIIGCWEPDDKICFWCEADPCECEEEIEDYE